MVFIKLATLLIMSTTICIADEEYDRLFDPDIDVDAVLDNDRVLNAYMACFFDEGPCAERPKLVKSKYCFFATSCCNVVDNRK